MLFVMRQEGKECKIIRIICSCYIPELDINEMFKTEKKMKKIKDILYGLFVLLLMLFGLWMTADAQTYKQENNTFMKNETSKSVTVPEKTIYLWKDSKGKTYSIYISKSGSCFIIRVSNKTGQEYRQYLGSEISEEICRKLNREYKAKKK